MFLTDKQRAMGLIFRNGVLHMRPSKIQLAIAQNRLAKPSVTGGESNSDGMSENEIVAVVFTGGTIGLRVCDGWRIAADGRVFDGPTPVPVLLNEVEHVWEEDVEKLFTIIN